MDKKLKIAQKNIFKRKNPQEALNFAVKHPEANIKKLQKIVMQAKNPEFIIKFAQEVPSADIQKLQKVVVEEFPFSLKVHFYNYVDRADKMELEDHFAGLENEILNRNDEEEIMEYALNAPFVQNIDRLNRIISVYQIHNVIKFANSKFSNVKFLASTLVARFNRDIDIGDIICFIRNLEKPADLSGLQLILQEYGSISNLISVANCPGINLTRLEDTVIERETAEDIYKFASSVVGANIEKLRNAVVKLGDTSVIEKFDKKFLSHATSKSSTKKPISVTNAENDVVADICIATDDN